MAIVCDDCPDVQVSREDFTNIPRAVSGLVDGYPEEGFTHRLIEMYWTKGVAIVVCLDEVTRGLLTSNIPNLRAWEGSRLKMVDLDAFPTFKRVVSWFLDPVWRTQGSMCNSPTG
jgi:hypothetical protein